VVIPMEICAKMESALKSSEGILLMTQSVEDGRRKFRRKVVREPAKVLVTRLGIRSCTTVDVSEAGIAVITAIPLRQGDTCMIALDLGASAARKRINAWGKVVYSNPDLDLGFRVGICFIDMDNYSQLLIRDLEATACG
jgi:hypothetical protein